MKKRIIALGSFPFSVSLLLMTTTFCFSESIDETPVDKSRLIKIIERQSAQLEEQKKSIMEQEKQFLQYKQRMQEEFAHQQKSIDQLKLLINAQSTEQETPKEQQTNEEVQKTAKNPVSSEQTRSSPAIKPVGQPPKPSEKQGRPLDVASIFDQPGVLTPRGSLNLEPSLSYSYSSNDRIALVGYTIIPAITIGLIDVRRISRDTFVGSLAARYGLTNRLEIEARVPYVYRHESASTTPFATQTDISDSTADGYGLGDIDFGVRYQLNRQKQGGPSFLASLRVKSDSGDGPFDVSYDLATNLYDESPTGSGFWGIQPGMTAIFPTDPAVFFGSINYMWNIEEDVGTVDGFDYGEFDPGDSFGFSFGMGLALNEKASFSLGYEHTVIMKNKQDGKTIDGQLDDIQVGVLLFGYSYLVNDDLSIIFSLGAGVTEAAPDIQLTIKLPYNIF